MTDPIAQLPDGAKHMGDLFSLVTLIGTLAQWLPALAALLTIIWTVLRIYDWFEARFVKPPSDPQ